MVALTGYIHRRHCARTSVARRNYHGEASAFCGGPEPSPCQGRVSLVNCFYRGEKEYINRVLFDDDSTDPSRNLQLNKNELTTNQSNDHGG
jgi:hypothetical protein